MSGALWLNPPTVVDSTQLSEPDTEMHTRGRRSKVLRRNQKGKEDFKFLFTKEALRKLVFCSIMALWFTLAFRGEEQQVKIEKEIKKHFPLSRKVKEDIKLKLRL